MFHVEHEMTTIFKNSLASVRLYAILVSIAKLDFFNYPLLSVYRSREKWKIKFFYVQPGLWFLILKKVFSLREMFYVEHGSCCKIFSNEWASLL